MRSEAVRCEAEGGVDAVAAVREAQFAQFVRAHSERAVGLAWRLIGDDRAAAEDVAQDAFLAAYRGLANFREDASTATWFYRILLRRAANHRRWRALRSYWQADAASAAPGTSSVDQCVDGDRDAVGDPALRRRITAALDTLTAKQREAFVLVHLDGFTTTDAAGVMNMAAGTLKSHLHRALKKMRIELADLAGANAQEHRAADCGPSPGSLEQGPAGIADDTGSGGRHAEE